MSEGMSMPQPAPEYRIGVLLSESDSLGQAVLDDEDAAERHLDEAGYAQAWGERGRHVASDRSRIAIIGEDVLRSAAEAIGHQVSAVVEGVVAGVFATGRSSSPTTPSTVSIQELEIKFGVKAVVGAGKAIEAFLTASGESTVEVTLKLKG